MNIFKASILTLHFVLDRQGFTTISTSLVFSTPTAFIKFPIWLKADYFTYQSSSLQRLVKGSKKGFDIPAFANLVSCFMISSIKWVKKEWGGKIYF